MPKRQAKNNTSPRGYLSWSQLTLWERDPNLYYQVYLGDPVQSERYKKMLFGTRYVELGKRMATTLENGFDVERDPLFEMLSVFLPPYPQREFAINVDFEGIPIIGKLDGWNKKTMTIGEYKTGKHWTQGMVDQAGQLSMYALLVWLKYKKLPKNIYLHWARTSEDVENGLRLTGDIKTFKTERSLADLIVFSKRIKTAWAGICELGKLKK